MLDLNRSKLKHVIPWNSNHNVPEEQKEYNCDHTGMDAKVAQTKIYGYAAITVADIIGTVTIYP